MSSLQTADSSQAGTIEDHLVRKGIISAEVLAAAVESQTSSRVSLASVLIESGSLTRDQWNRAVAETQGFSFIDLKPDDVDPAAAHLLPENMVRRLDALPVRIDGRQLHVAMTSPLDLAAHDKIALMTGYEVLPVVVPEKSLTHAIQQHFSIENATKQEIINIRIQEMNDEEAKRDAVTNEAMPEGDEGAVVRLTNSIVNGAIDAGASDIHLEPQEPEMRLRYRVDGILNSIMTIPRTIESALVSRLKVVSDLDISEKRIPQDGHFMMSRSGKDYDFRVSTMPTVRGEKVVIRVLDKDSAMVDLGTLGLSPSELGLFEHFIAQPYGIILITGPTGSGKTTTLYAALGALNATARNIVTVENPVEYCLPHINQVQVNNAAGMTFPKTLRAFLRQDPDIIMIGEIRDHETAELAVDAALTGHLVLSTLHTNDSAGAAIRLIEMGVEPFLLSSCLLGVVAQRLIRKTCRECRTVYPATRAEREVLSPGAERDEIKLSRGKGCHFCHQTGYHGRTGVYEVLQVTDRVRKLIAARESAAVIRANAVEDGLVILHEQGMRKVLDGTTTLEEVRRILGDGER